MGKLCALIMLFAGYDVSEGTFSKKEWKSVKLPRGGKSEYKFHFDFR